MNPILVGPLTVTRRHVGYAGIDLVSADGVVLAPEGGRAETFRALGECGHGLTLYGDSGLKWRFCHFAGTPLIGDGETITAGAPLGVMGTSGHVTGRHLHLETYGAGWKDAWRAIGIPEQHVSPPVGGGDSPVMPEALEVAFPVAVIVGFVVGVFV